MLSLRSHTHRPALRAGARDALPIALGYLAVSFTLGIAARNAGLNPLQGFFASLLCNASAGEYAGFTAIAARASLWELAAITLVANARYLLMGIIIVCGLLGSGAVVMDAPTGILPAAHRWRKPGGNRFL